MGLATVIRLSSGADERIVLRVGLTGGIACGKSLVVSRLAVSGLATIDLDVVAHEVMAPGGAAHAGVAATFGPRVLAADGSIDRDALGTLVFADADARARLDAIVHPEVRRAEAARVAELEAGGHTVVVSDAALLVEAGAHLRFDRLVVVHCPPEVQTRRLMARDGIPEGAARARVAAQMPIEEKRRYAHVEVDTGGTLADTERAARGLADALVKLATHPRTPLRLAPQRTLGALVHSGTGGPRGLDPRTLLGEATAEGGIELGRLARRLDPPWTGPWYRAARPSPTGPWPEALAAPLALWAAAVGADDDWLDAAAASLARLTHEDAASVAGACLAARAARAVVAGGLTESLEGRLVAWEAASQRWGGAPPARRIRDGVRAAARHASSPAAARAAAGAAGAEASFAGSLVGLAVGAPRPDGDQALAALADRLAALGERLAGESTATDRGRAPARSHERE